MTGWDPNVPANKISQIEFELTYFFGEQPVTSKIDDVFPTCMQHSQKPGHKTSKFTARSCS